MRIQHNIMAMNAYRNYTNNVSALKGNLEKLSSGYKINRAGDDAAGLAISEKMRAQITALNQAQSNAKSGISLVQTAEGALQEVHDMLNRMVKLAEQSANGTFDVDTDRAQLEKEVKQLRDEINRIADSSNFNGIKLLNGDLSNGAKDAVAASEGNFDIPGTGSLQDDLGTKTITHTSTLPSQPVSFGVELGDLEFSHAAGESMKISIGDYTIEVGDGSVNSKAQGTKITGADVVEEFLTATDNTGDVKGADGLVITGAGTVTINNIAFSVAKNAAGTGLVFTQTGDGDFDGDMAVSVSTEGTAEIKGGDAPTDDPTADDPTEVKGGASAKTTYTYDFDGIDGLSAGSYDVDIGGKTVTVTLEDGKTTANDLAKAVADALQADPDTYGIADGLVADPASVYAVSSTGSTVVFTSSDDGDTSGDAVSGKLAVAASADKAEGGAKGTYNTQTTVTKPSAAGAEKNLASTTFNLTADKLVDGAQIKIGDKTYDVSTADADKNSTSKLYVGDLDLSKESGMKAAIDRLSVVADNNAVWSVGYGGEGGKVTVTEKVVDATTGKGWMDDGKNKEQFDLTTVDGIKASLGYKTPAQAAVEADPTKGLKLQIGDTSDSYNQLTVSINSIKSTALKDITYDTGMTLEQVSVADQDIAAKSLTALKGMVNYISDIRGELGATQNRLDHTINNLSVMTENIQDAESVIRDTDVADEMMAYTKNNILIQSAQAMLAQANMVPQGVLQLLG